MWKRLAILGGGALIVAAILMAVYYQQRNAIGEGYYIKCVQASEPTPATNSLACKIYPSENADQGRPKPQWWNVLIAWPEGITAWLLLLTLGAIFWQAWVTRKAAQSAEKQIALQTSAMRQWINVVPLGINIPRTLENPCEITLQFEVLNKTDYLVTIKGIEFELIPNIHLIGKFKVDCDFPLVPRKSEDDSAFPFAGKCVIDISELDGSGKIFIVAGTVTFLDCMDREQVQSFQDVYRGFMDGRLERMKPASITAAEDKSEGQKAN
jgi:hypothetical protein